MTRTRRAGHGRPPVERRPSTSARRRSAEPLVAGPRWYRQRMRRLGWLAGLVPMALIGIAAWAGLAAGDGRSSGMFGLVAGVSAAPGLLLAGAPFGDSGAYVVAVFASVPLWLGLGFVAARRATVSPVATWADYARELLWLTIAVVAGACVALVAATLWLGESLVA